MYGFVAINLVVHIFTTVKTVKMEVLVFQKTLIHISAIHVVTYRRTVGVSINLIKFLVSTAHPKTHSKARGLVFAALRSGVTLLYCQKQECMG
jgi:hypothetical protein